MPDIHTINDVKKDSTDKASSRRQKKPMIFTLNSSLRCPPNSAPGGLEALDDPATDRDFKPSPQEDSDSDSDSDSDAQDPDSKEAEAPHWTHRTTRSSAKLVRLGTTPGESEVRDGNGGLPRRKFLKSLLQKQSRSSDVVRLSNGMVGGEDGDVKGRKRKAGEAGEGLDGELLKEESQDLVTKRRKVGGGDC